jgi:D-lactate dehydrogenase
MTQRKILFFDSKSYDERTFREALKVLNGQDKLHFTFLESKLNEETISEAQGYDGICIVNSDARYSNVMDKIHTMCDTVKIIALRSAGYKGSSVNTVKQYGLQVCSVPSFSPHAVAEHSVALLLSLNRNMHRAYFRTKLHNFTLDGLVGIDLFGKTVGIIGTGGVGMCAVKIFLGFGCKVLAYDIQPDEKAAQEQGFQCVTMDELLQQSDVGKKRNYLLSPLYKITSNPLVSLHAPSNTSTHHLINKEALDKMKKGAMLINTSRGSLVDAKALVDCLKSGKLRGAALDVYENEKHYFFNDYSQKV